jgi:polyisoprenoid-binding protein YceI
VNNKIVIGIVVVAVLAIAGVFLYAQVRDNNQPDELSLDDRPAQTTTTDGSSDSAPDASAGTPDGTWVIVADSEVGYRVVEDFIGGIANAEAVGRSSVVAGEVTIAGDAVSGATFEVQMASVESDSGRRDGQFTGRIMSVDEFPTATFTLTEDIVFDSTPAVGADLTATATGDLTLRGVTQEVTFEANARWDGDQIVIQGAIPVVFSDYDIPNPSNAAVSTRDNGTLEFLLVLEPA